jgi:hypothetical protein
MCPGNIGQGSSANGDRNANAQKSLKAYKAPQFEILTPDQAAAWLRARAVPGDAGAQQLLKIATELAKKRQGGRAQGSHGGMAPGVG